MRLSSPWIQLAGNLFFLSFKFYLIFHIKKDVADIGRSFCFWEYVSPYCDSYKTQYLLSPDKRGRGGTVPACGAREILLSEEYTQRENGVTGGAKCTGAVCPHKIIQLDVLTHVRWHQCVWKCGRKDMRLGVMDITQFHWVIYKKWKLLFTMSCYCFVADSPLWCERDLNEETRSIKTWNTSFPC